MSRFVRQSSQLARLARLSQHHALQRTVRPAVARAASSTRVCASSPSLRLRCYSTNPPQKPDPQEKNDNKDSEKRLDGKAPEGEDTQKASIDAEKPKNRDMPLPEGWVRLTKEELAQLESFNKLMPEGNRQVLKDVLEGLVHNGAPAEVRDLLAKMRKGPGNLSIMDKGRLMRCVFLIADRMAEWEASK